MSNTMLRGLIDGGFLFLYSKQYKNNFQKIELETSFQIIIFIFYMFGSHFKKKNFKILKTKIIFWETISIFEI